MKGVFLFGRMLAAHNKRLKLLWWLSHFMFINFLDFQLSWKWFSSQYQSSSWCWWKLCMFEWLSARENSSALGKSTGKVSGADSTAGENYLMCCYSSPMRLALWQNIEKLHSRAFSRGENFPSKFVQDVVDPTWKCKGVLERFSRATFFPGDVWNETVGKFSVVFRFRGWHQQHFYFVKLICKREKSLLILCNK